MSNAKALTRTNTSQGDGAMTRPQVSIDGVENALLQGDLSRLSPQERLSYYEKVCTSVGLNPLTRPFEYIRLNGKLTLYAKRDAAEQLRRINGVSITDMQTDRMQDVYLVRVHAVDKDGRTDVATGAVPIKGASGDRLVNALMKAETKAKRRVTLSICGLGWLDETELETIDSAETVAVDHETGEIQEAKAPPSGKASSKKKRSRDERDISEGQRKRLFAIAKNEGGYTDEGLKRLIGDYGYGSTRDIKRYDYDAIVKDARKPEQAATYNRDPNTPDMFDEAGKQTEEGGGADYEAVVARYEERLRNAFSQGKEAVTGLAEEFNGEVSGWPDAEIEKAREHFNALFQKLRQEQEEAKAGQATKAAEAMQRGQTALPKASAPEPLQAREPLSEDVPMRSALVDAGLETRDAVQAAYARGELQDVKGIGPKTEREIAHALNLADEASDGGPPADGDPPADGKPPAGGKPSVTTDDGTDLFD